jgi:hypothetical protein
MSEKETKDAALVIGLCLVMLVIGLMIGADTARIP